MWCDGIPSREPGGEKAMQPKLPTLERAIAVAAVLGLTTISPADLDDDDTAGAGGAATRINVTGIVRDFIEGSEPDGHPDFEYVPGAGAGLYAGSVAFPLGVDNKPVYTGDGYKVIQQWTDSAGNPIAPHVYDAALGDLLGSRSVSSEGGITSAETFAQWFRDVPGVNLSAPLTISLIRQPDGGYVFDDTSDPAYAELGGFFPVDDRHFGTESGGHNYHFTFELHVEFTYDESAGQSIRFRGDDDVWIFVDRRLVIDLGGIHSAYDQTFQIDRLGDLVDGRIYPIHIFFAERHRYSSSFRIETSFPLRATPVPTVTSAGD
jgi:fibro-slime domain-containing protein